MSLPTRRRFINTSIGGLAAAAMSAQVVLGADEKTADPAVPAKTDDPKKKRDAKPESLSGANDRINVAVIGCGDRGQYHIDELMAMSDHVNIVGLCDPDAARIEGQAQRVEEDSGTAPKTYTDVRKMLEDKSIDVVTIATTNHWHSLASIWAIQAGKDVYVEKPLSHNVMEGRRVVEFARKHNRIVLHGTQSRSMRAMHQAMRFIHEGGIGKVTLARALCYKRRQSIGKTDGEQKVPESVDYDLWCGPAPVKPLRRKKLHYEWHWFWDTGNGDIGNQGVHQMDIALWGLNRKTIANKVQCIGGRLGYVDDAETPNTQLAMFHYDDGGAPIIFEVRGLESQPAPGAKSGVCNIFYGTEGTLVVNGYDNCTAYAPDESKIEMPKYDDLKATGNHFTTFLKAIRARELDHHQGDAEAGHISSAMCHLANISYRLGKKVPFNAATKSFGDDKAPHATLIRLEQHLKSNKLELDESNYVLGPELTFDTKTEKFTGNDAANEQLTREYRAPFVVPDHVA